MQVNRPDLWGGELERLMNSADVGDNQRPNGRVGGRYVPTQTSLGIQVPYRSGRSPFVRSPPPMSPTSSQMAQRSAVREVSGLAQAQPHGRGGPDPAVTRHVPPSGGRIVLDQLTRAGRAKNMASSKGAVWRPPTSYQLGYEETAAKPHMARYSDTWTPQWTPYSQGPAAFTSAIHERPSTAAEGPQSFSASHQRHAPAVAFNILNDYVSARSRGFSAFSPPTDAPQTPAQPEHYRDSRPNPKMKVSYNSKVGFAGADAPPGGRSEVWGDQSGQGRGEIV